MFVDIIMPQLGESIVEGTIGKWLKKEGDWVERDESLVEVVTEKVVMELPSPASGTLYKILVNEGEKVEVGGIIGKIEVKEEAVPIEKKEEEIGIEAEAEKIEEESPLRIKGRKRASPLVRKIARERGIDLEKIEGTGLGGRVTKKDILSFVERMEGRIAGIPEIKEKELKEGEELIPLSPIRRSIAEHMVKSVHISPHVTSVIEVDMTEIVRFRERIKNELKKNKGIRLTYLPFIIEATINALKKFPVLNSSWTDKGILIKKYINIGIAVALEDGLLVPVIKNADEKNLIGLAREIEELSEKARKSGLSIEDVRDGTFTITNPGSFGTLISTPIINQPQAGILGVEAIIKKPVVVGDAIAIRSRMNLCLSYDHRVLDGAIAGRFLAFIKKYLEDFKFPEL
jgi:2-oxoglutarate dehydrogenase complex dihydrolipoamide succinyltransferase (E2) component